MVMSCDKMRSRLGKMHLKKLIKHCLTLKSFYRSIRMLIITHSWWIILGVPIKCGGQFEMLLELLSEKGTLPVLFIAMEAS